MLLSHEATRFVLSWDAVRDRIIIMRLSNNRFVKVTVVQVYAPTMQQVKVIRVGLYSTRNYSVF